MHPLELILQLQVGSDQAAVLSLPSIISSLTPSHLQPSQHLQKWILRVTSLIHSKHHGARWAGLCLALQSSILSNEIMVGAAQNWIALALPMLSRNETLPTWKASIRLLEFIFSSAVSMPEFQRQLVTPNVPKFSAALLCIAEKSENHDIRHISLTTLTHLIPLYPTLHRQLHPTLSAFSFCLLSGSSTSPTFYGTVEDACRLHAVLHFTGGKVGAAPLWRKSIDTALVNAWSAFVALRATFKPPPRPTINIQPTFDSLPTDPVTVVLLSLDRLKCSISLVSELLEAVTSRPVPVPVGSLVNLALCLLRCTPDEAVDAHFDSTRRALEISIIPEIWQLGCAFVSHLAKTLRHHLNSHLSRIISLVTHHLEQPLSKLQRTQFLCLLPPLLSHTYALHSPIPPTRLVKTLFPLLTPLLSGQAEVQKQPEEFSTAASKKGKKRARGYEGDEVFKVGRGVLCPTPEDGEIVEMSLEALDCLLSNPLLSAPIRTLTVRLLVTLLMEVPRRPAATLSHDLSLHGRVHAKLVSICNRHVLAGSSGWINSAVGLVVNATVGAMNGSETVLKSATEIQHVWDLILHPRLPPLLRTQPPIEAVSLFRSESSIEDKAARDALGVNTMKVVQQMTEAPNSEIMVVQPIEVLPPIVDVAREELGTVKNTTTGPTLASMPTPALPVPASPTTASCPDTEMVLSTVKGASIVRAPPSSTGLKTAEIVQPMVASVSTYSETFNAPNLEDSDEDEEMPEIDTRSDSD